MNIIGSALQFTPIQGWNGLPYPPGTDVVVRGHCDSDEWPIVPVKVNQTYGILGFVLAVLYNGGKLI